MPKPCLCHTFRTLSTQKTAPGIKIHVSIDSRKSLVESSLSKVLQIRPMLTSPGPGRVWAWGGLDFPDDGPPEVEVGVLDGGRDGKYSSVWGGRWRQVAANLGAQIRVFFGLLTGMQVFSGFVRGQSKSPVQVRS